MTNFESKTTPNNGFSCSCASSVDKDATRLKFADFMELMSTKIIDQKRSSAEFTDYEMSKCLNLIS